MKIAGPEGPAIWSLSSVGQSSGLIIRGSQVQVLQGPRLKKASVISQMPFCIEAVRHQGAGVTVQGTEALRVPMEAVIVQLPAATPVTRPLSLTVAMDGSLVLQERTSLVLIGV